MLHSCVFSTGPHVVAPAVTWREDTCVPPPQGLEHALHTVQAEKEHPVIGHAWAALQAWLWMKPPPVDDATFAHATVLARVGGSEYRTRVLHVHNNKTPQTTRSRSSKCMPQATTDHSTRKQLGSHPIVAAALVCTRSRAKMHSGAHTVDS